MKCVFDRNLFHAVFLAQGIGDKAAKAQMLYALENTFVRAETSIPAHVAPHPDDALLPTFAPRADLVLTYNPIADEYSDTFFDGKPVRLSPDDSTANLVDPTW